MTVCSAASYQAAKLTEIIHPRFVALARSILAIEGWLIGAAANGFWLLFVGKIVLGGGLGLMYFPATLEPAEFFSGTGRTMATAFIDAGSGAGQVTRFIKKKTLSHYPLSILISMSSLPLQPQSIKQKPTLRSYLGPSLSFFWYHRNTALARSEFQMCPISVTDFIHPTGGYRRPGHLAPVS